MRWWICGKFCVRLLLTTCLTSAPSISIRFSTQPREKNYLNRRTKSQFSAEKSRLIEEKQFFSIARAKVWFCDEQISKGIFEHWKCSKWQNWKLQILHRGQQASCWLGLSGSGNGKTIVTVPTSKPANSYQRNILKTYVYFSFGKHSTHTQRKTHFVGGGKKHAWKNGNSIKKHSKENKQIVIN